MTDRTMIFAMFMAVVTAIILAPHMSAASARKYAGWAVAMQVFVVALSVGLQSGLYDWLRGLL